MVKEYDAYGSIEIIFSCDCLGKLNQVKIKSLLKKTFDKYLEDEPNISCIDEDGCTVACDFDYEELE